MGCFDTDKEVPKAPELTVPKWAEGLPPEILNIIRGQVGAQLPEPTEFGLSSQALQSLLGFQPSQLQEPAEFGQVATGLQDLLALQPEKFQLPIEDIQKALQAQQDIQMQQYQKQIRPVLAQQGQLDSTYYANLLGDFTKGQQAQTYGTTADLLTQQALKNAQIQQFLPQFQSGVLGQLGQLGQARQGVSQFNIGLEQWTPQFQANIANQLASLGGQRAGIGQFNLQLPFQTTIPALQQQYQTALGEAGQRATQANLQWGVDLQRFQAKEQQKAELAQQLGSLAFAGATGGIGGAAGLYGSGIGAGQGALMGMTGFSPGMSQMFKQMPRTPQIGSTRFNPQSPFNSQNVNLPMGF